MHTVFNSFPTLHTKRLVLSELLMDDLPEYMEIMLDPKVREYLAPEDLPNNDSEGRYEINYWRNIFYAKRSIYWKIALQESKGNKLIGNIGFNTWNFSNQRAEINYELGSKYWGNGYMTEALQAVVEFAIQKMLLYRIEARTMLSNERSKSLLLRMNFQHEGVLRGYRIINNKPCDICLFSLIRPDYKAP